MKNEIKERPMLFSGPMVRAIIDGRKTQTRRVVSPQPPEWAYRASYSSNGWGTEKKKPHWCFNDEDAFESFACDCPYGRPGDRLWVRETHAYLNLDGYAPVLVYRADGTHSDGDGKGCALPDGVVWKPSIFCKREASRITLEITAIRVERLQDISKADAIAEGGEWQAGDGCSWGWNHGHGEYVHDTAKASYAELWESINGPASWEENPYVWVIEFKVLS